MSDFPRVERWLPIDQLLPHRRPMLLVDEIVSIEGGTIRCATTLREDCPFVRDGRVSAVISLELMAQSVGVLLALWAYGRRQRLTGGLLLGSPTLDLEVDSLSVGKRLDIVCRHLWGNDDVWKFECEVYERDRLVARGVVNVLRTRGNQPPP